MASTTTQTTAASVLNIRPLNRRTNEEYQNSFGSLAPFAGPFGAWQMWHVVDRVDQIWSELQGQIVDLLVEKSRDILPPRTYRGPREPCHALRCYMVGLNKAHASPHVAIICAQKWLSTQVRDIVLRSGLLQERGWVGFLKLKGEIRQPGGAWPGFQSKNLDQPARRSNTPNSPWFNTAYAAKSEDFKLRQSDVAISSRSDTPFKTLCGARVAVSYADGLVSVATLGGIIELDGEAYGLTASHVFLSRSSDHDDTEYKADSDSEYSIFDFDEDDLDPFVRALSSAEAPEAGNQPLESRGLETSLGQSLQDAPHEVDQSNQELLGSIKNPPEQIREGICTNCRREKQECDGARPVCSRCTLDEIEDSCSYNAPPRTESYTVSSNSKILRLQDIEDPNYDPAFESPHMTGELPTMSWTLGSQKSFGNTSMLDFQWALVSIGHESLRMAHKVNDFHTDGFHDRLRVTSVSDSKVPNGGRLFLATTRGGVSAVGISSKSSVKLASSKGYQSLSIVQLDHAENGDCGSWVVDHDNGLIGMLVASCDSAREAYILPAPEIFAEITNVSKGSVTLPSLEASDESNRPSKRKPIIEHPYNQPTLKNLGIEHLYIPLKMNEIRILTVFPGIYGSLIECDLSVRNLGDPGEYEALSYAWETWEPSSSVLFHGQHFKVTPSLASALQALRHVSKLRYLWVDAICINQEDFVERNTQVPLMANIMESAKHVCIWLGEEDEDSHLAFSPYHSVLELHDIQRLISNDLMLRQTIALSGLAQRRWFHRRWCLQDVCKAKEATLYCGTHTMAWTTFADVITLICAQSNQSEDFSLHFTQREWRKKRNPSLDLMYLGRLIELVNNVFRKTGDGQIPQPVFSLEDLVTNVVWLNVSIPHDSVYSLLWLAKGVKKRRRFQHFLGFKTVEPTGLSPSVLQAIKTFRKPLDDRSEKFGILIDYSKDFAGVCQDFVRMAVHDSNSLDMLCRPWAPMVAGLPSWVSTVSEASMNTQMDGHFVRINANGLVSSSGPGRSKLYEASGPNHPTFEFDSCKLYVKGFILDKVYAKKAQALMGNIPPGWMESLGWINTSTLPPEKIWRLLVADRDCNGRFPPSYYRLACRQAFQRTKPDSSFNLSQRFQQVAQDQGLNVSKQLAASTAFEHEFLLRVQSVVWNRRLILTQEHSFIGLAPGDIKKGDVVAILYGCSVPVMLRQISDTKNQEVEYKMIGECYIDGMMDGQALDLKDEKGLFEETLVIV